MTKQQKKQDINDQEQMVRDYLKANPNYLFDNPEVLADLNLAHDCGSATSLMEFQADHLRKSNRVLNKKIKVLFRNACENEIINEKMINMCMALALSRTFDDVIQCLEQQLMDDFKVDYIKLYLYDINGCKLDVAGQIDFNQDGLSEFEQYYNKRNHCYCGRLKKKQLNFLFTENANEIKSSALIPFQNNNIKGMVALGSCDENRFHPGIGTSFLEQLSQLLSEMVESHLAA